MSEIEPREIEWLWYPFIPYGKVTLLQGDPDDGKSTFMLTIAALLTRGEPLPFTDTGKPHEPISVIYQTTEDDADDTIVPRFIKANGDRERLLFISEKESPLSSYIGDCQINAANEVRPRFNYLIRIAKETGCAIVIIKHLLYHGYDETRAMFWADGDTGCSSQYWGRSIGWYACALVDTLDYIDDEKIRKELIQMAGDLALGLKEVQHPQSGLWYQVLDRYSEYGNYPEYSCSCMFVYFLRKAVRRGYLGSEYAKVAKKTYYGIIREFLEVDEKGRLNLKGTVYVSGLGGDRYRDGSYEYYISEPKQINNLLGIGAFLMASAEMEA